MIFLEFNSLKNMILPVFSGFFSKKSSPGMDLLLTIQIEELY